MLKKEKIKEHENAKRDSFKHKRRLFKELPEALLKSIKGTGTGVLQVDLGELDSGTSSRWRQITRLFEDLSKYDHKTIGSYLEDNPANGRAKCSAAIEYYGTFIKRMEKPRTGATPPGSLGSKEELKRTPTKDDWIKIYVISYQYVSNKLVDLAIPCTAEAFSSDSKDQLLESINHMKTLNDFLLLILPTKQSQITLLQYETALVLFLGEKIGDMQEKLSNMAFSINPFTMSEVFYYHFETLAMLTCYNAGKKFMKDAADDGIKYAFEIFEQSLRSSLSSSLFAEVYSSLIQGTEKWTCLPNSPHLFFSAKYGKKKLQYFHHPDLLGNDGVRFSLGYVNLYYANKIALTMMDRDMFKQEERTVVTLAAFLKKNITALLELCFVKDSLKPLSESEIPQVEALLNENCICLKFMKRILTAVDNPLNLIEKFSLSLILKNLLSVHIIVTIRNGFTTAHPPEDYSIASQDALASVFGTLHRLKRLRTAAPAGSGTMLTAKLVKKSHVHLMILVDEVVMEAVTGAWNYLGSNQRQLGKLRELLVEYFADEKFAVTEKYREFLTSLYSGPIFKYTAPESLEPSKLQGASQDSINAKAVKLLVKALARTIRQDKKTLISSFQKLIQLIAASKDNSASFGLLKLTYCILTGEVYDDWGFYQLLALGQRSSAAEDRESAESRKDSLCFTQEFIDSKGLRSLLRVLLNSYKVEDELQDNVKILEQGVLLLLNIPSMCKALIGGHEEMNDFLDLAMTKRRCNAFVLEITKTCLQFLKTHSAADAATYFPDLIARTIHKTLAESIDDEEVNGLCFPFYDALNGFLEGDGDVKLLVPYQNALFHSKAWMPLISLLTTHK